MITLTPDQKKAVDYAVETWGKELVTIGGYAGTGKSTITPFIVKAIRSRRPDINIAFACYTGKAKSVLEKKLKAIPDILRGGDSIGTLHQLVYRPNRTEKRTVDEKTKKEKIKLGVEFTTKDDSEKDPDLVIIDEASMVNGDIWNELMLKGYPVIAIGDHGQLPPVSSSFSLMKSPGVRLEKIHRQAESSPIIRLSMIAREEGRIPEGRFAPNVLKTRDGSVINGAINQMKRGEDTMMICGTNRKRCRINDFIRTRLFEIAPDHPQPGEKVICLQNNHKAKIFNGMIGEILSCEIFNDHWYRVRVQMDGFIFNGEIFRYQFGKAGTCRETVPECELVHPEEFGDLFDYGYCLTTWKAQGSEADNVIFYEEQSIKHWIGGNNWNRFLYTAVTRAKNNLIVIGD